MIHTLIGLGIGYEHLCCTQTIYLFNLNYRLPIGLDYKSKNGNSARYHIVYYMVACICVSSIGVSNGVL